MLKCMATFLAGVEENHHDAILRHVKSTIGSRQDIVCTNVGPIHVNLPRCIAFLDKRLRKRKHSNALEENFVHCYQVYQC